MTSNTVVPKTSFRMNSVTEDRTKELLAAGLNRAILNHGKSTVAEAGDCTTRCIDNALTHKTQIKTHTLVNILRLEPTVMWELLSEMGFKVVPKDMMMSPDMHTAAEMSRALTTLIQALDDGRRDHRETLELAKLLRPLVQKLTAIVHEADELLS